VDERLIQGSILDP